MTFTTTPPSFVRQDHVVFAYPYDTPTLTIQIKNPELGDIERYSQTRLVVETRGGDLSIFRDSSWPTDNELALTFTELSGDEKQDLEDFIEATLGVEFKYTDHNGLIWKAIITTPDVLVVQDAQTPCGGRYTINLTLNVELMSWP